MRSQEAPTPYRPSFTEIEQPMTHLNRRHAAFLVILMTVASTVVVAQSPDTLEVELDRKSPTHPFYGSGADSCYVIDGVEARELTFVRGRRYVFHINAMDSNWIFYLSRKDIGFGSDAISVGLPTRYYAFSGDYFPYMPVAESPDIAYYQSSRHFRAGGKISIVDSLPSAVDASGTTTAALLRARAWTAAGGSRLTVQYSLPRPSTLRLEIFDALGRSITTEDLGEHAVGERVTSVEIAGLVPGFYLYRLTMLVDGLSVTGSIVFAR